MNKIYKTANHKSRVSITVIGGFLATAILFLALPFTQLLNLTNSGGTGIELSDYSMPPPPPPPAEPPPPKEDEDDKDKPELETKPPPLTLAQLEIAINPGDRGASGDFGFGTFTADFNALEELEVFELADLDKIPNPLHRVAPTYPYEMKQSGISGSVEILFVCGADGKVKRVSVKSSTHREFEDSAIRAIRDWRFEPGMKDGKPGNVRMLIPFNFNVKN